VNGQVDLAYFSHSLTFCVHGGGSQHDRNNVRIQQGDVGDWMRVADTSMPSPFDLLESGKEKALESLNYDVKARSIVVLLESS
jgi:hypothetical protein